MIHFFKVQKPHCGYVNEPCDSQLQVDIFEVPTTFRNNGIVQNTLSIIYLKLSTIPSILQRRHKQTMETQTRCRDLIWVYSICFVK